MMTRKVFIFLCASIAVSAEACTLGEAQVGKGQNGPALEVCQSGIMGSSFRSGQQGVGWYEFFDGNKDNKEFVAQAEKVAGMKYDEILKSTKGNYGTLELFSDDKESLKSLAKSYSKWSGADDANAKKQADETPEKSSLNQFIATAKDSEYGAKRIASGKCDGDSGLKAQQLTFSDGYKMTILPLGLKGPDAGGKYTMKYIQSTGLGFSNRADVQERTFTKAADGSIDWSSTDGKTYKVSSAGFSEFNNQPVVFGGVGPGAAATGDGIASCLNASRVLSGAKTSEGQTYYSAKTGAGEQ